MKSPHIIYPAFGQQHHVRFVLSRPDSLRTPQTLHTAPLSLDRVSTKLTKLQYSPTSWELSENILQHIWNKWPPHLVRQLPFKCEWFKLQLPSRTLSYPLVPIAQCLFTCGQATQVNKRYASSSLHPSSSS